MSETQVLRRKLWPIQLFERVQVSQKIIPQKALFLGLLALTIDLALFLLFDHTQYRLGTAFLFLCSSAYGAWAALLAASISAVPFSLLTESYFSFLRILLLCIAVSYVASARPKLPIFFPVTAMWIFIFLPTIYISDFFISEAYFSGAVSSDLFCAFFAGLILLFPSSYGKMELPLRQTSSSSVLAQVLCFFTFLVGLTYLFVSGTEQSALNAELQLVLLSLFLGIILAKTIEFLLHRDLVLPFKSRPLPTTSGWRDVEDQKFCLAQDTSHWMTLEEELPCLTTQAEMEGAGICVVNKHLKVSYANDKFYELFSIAACCGRSLQTIGLPVEALVTLMDLIQCGFTRSYEQREMKINHLPNRLRFYSIEAKRSRSGKELILSVEDITHKRVMPENTLQAQKANTLSDMAIPIAHSFNNFLTMILGQAEMAKYQKDPNKALSDIIDITQEASDYVWKFLGYSETRPVELKHIHVASFLKEYIPIFQEIGGDKLELASFTDSPNHHILCDRTLLTQSITNLIINARESYHSGSGPIQLSVNKEELDEDASRIIVGARAGSFVRIRVRDFGKGMTSDVLEKAFQPTFTTKKEQAKAGLGLAAVFAILRAHDGFLTFESTPGKGTEVSLYFPLVEKAPESSLQTQIEKTRDDHLTRGGHEKILVVEDEPSVRNLVVNMLNTLGYQASGVENAIEALDRCKEANFDLVLVDLMMPKMNGLEFIEELKKDKKDFKTVIMTGYGITTLARKHGHSVLPKPFDMKALSSFIATALDSTETPILSPSEPGIHSSHSKPYEEGKLN